MSCHAACNPQNLPHCDLGQSSQMPSLKRNRRWDTSLRPSSGLNYQSRKSGINNSNHEDKYLHADISQPPCGVTEKKSSSYFHHSESSRRFKHCFGATTRRYVEKTRKENGIKNVATIQSSRAGKKHKSTGWSEDYRLLKCRRLGYLFSNCSHVLEKVFM